MFCYVPATSAAHNRLLFLLLLFTVLMKQTRQAVRAIKHSIFLDVYVPFQNICLKYRRNNFEELVWISFIDIFIKCLSRWRESLIRC
jgi:cyclopropane fatty-acyl-phospholipid synthase-like methyltransferase